MKILLTGCNGLLGQAILNAAPEFEKEHDIKLDFIGVDLSEPPAASCPTEFHRGSYTDAVLVESLVPRCAAIIHTAALHGGCLKMHSPTQFMEANLGGLATLLEACVQHNLRRFVFSSTMEILVGRDWLASGMARLDENCPPRCDSIYSTSKLLGEQLGEFYANRRGIEFLALRYMNIELPPFHPLELITRGITARDAARANLLALLAPDIGYEMLLIGNQTPITNLDIARSQDHPDKIIESRWPGAAALIKEHQLELHGRFFANPINITRANRVLKWQPRDTFENWLRSQGWKPPVVSRNNLQA